MRWTDVRDRIFGRIDPIAAGGREYRTSHADNANVTVYEGTARFTGPRRLAVTGTTEGSPRRSPPTGSCSPTAGGRSSCPNWPGSPVYTSDTIMRLDELPRRMVIIGGGFIAAEFAHVFSAFGVDVTVVDPVGRDAARARTRTSAARFTELAGQRWDVRLNRTLRGGSVVDGGLRVDLDGASRSRPTWCWWRSAASRTRTR